MQKVNAARAWLPLAHGQARHAGHDVAGLEIYRGCFRARRLHCTCGDGFDFDEEPGPMIDDCSVGGVGGSSARSG